MRRLPGPLLIVLATILWGTTGTAQELAPEAATPLAVGSLRLLLAAVVVMLIAGVAGELHNLSKMRRPATLVAAIGVATYQPFFFLGVDRTGVVVGTIVAIGSAPVFAGLLAWGYDKTAPSRLWVTATGVAIAGVAILVAAGSDAAASAEGIVFALVAGAAYATYVIAARQFARDGNVVGSTAIIFSIAAALLLPLLAVDDLGWVATTAGTLTVLHLGVLATAAAYLLFAAGLRSTKSTTATTLSLGEPVTAALLGVVAVGERPPPLAWVGFALVLIALVAVATEGRSNRLSPSRSRAS
ncbi:MAG: EamA family transporter [bacterium]|nr:EamA family transporter [bacterium]MCP4965618.1 EamA family transporter [bacterium]